MMETDLDELSLREVEVADTYTLVVTGILDDGYEVTQSFINRAEMAVTDEGTSNVGLQRVRQNAETRVKIFIRDRSISASRVDEVRRKEDGSVHTPSTSNGSTSQQGL